MWTVQHLAACEPESNHGSPSWEGPPIQYMSTLQIVNDGGGYCRLAVNHMEQTALRKSQPAPPNVHTKIARRGLLHSFVSVKLDNEIGS